MRARERQARAIERMLAEREERAPGLRVDLIGQAPLPTPAQQARIDQIRAERGQEWIEYERALGSPRAALEAWEADELAEQEMEAAGQLAEERELARAEAIEQQIAERRVRRFTPGGREIGAQPEPDFYPDVPLAATQRLGEPRRGLMVPAGPRPSRISVPTRTGLQEVETRPTEGQKEAGNYKKAHVRIDGLDVSIENPAGSVRRGTDKSGRAWEQAVVADYGYIRGTKGRDGDQVDVFIRPNSAPEDGPVWIVNQQDPETGEFDEHKAMLGYASEDEARAAYLGNYEPGWQGLGSMARMEWAEFKAWARSGRKRAPVEPEIQSAMPAAEAKGQPVDNIEQLPVTPPVTPPVTETAPAPETGTQTQETGVLGVLSAEKQQRAEELKARLRKKLYGQVNTGIDPEILTNGIELGALYVEAGARKFADWSKAVTADLGEAIKPYLKSIYLGVRNWPGMEAYRGEMDSADRVESARDAEKAAPESQPAQKGTIPEAIRDRLLAGDNFVSIVSARKVVADVLGRKLEAAEMKAVDEQVEQGVILAARAIVAEGRSPQETFDRLLDLMERQPGLNVRSSTSVMNQAYSTPIPMGYLASRLAGITDATSVFEPTAGHGALLIDANPERTLANELDMERAEFLGTLGYQVLEGDALRNIQTALARGKRDVVIANPPFGRVRDDQGIARIFDAVFYQTKEIDHAIAMQALRVMKDDGRAVLILGGANGVGDARAAEYQAKTKSDFYYFLYNNFNVVDHFTVNGDLYSKQGAGFPVDMIVIDGKGKSRLDLPAVSPPRSLQSWEDLKGLLDASVYPQNAAGGVVQPAAAPSGSGAVAQNPQPAGVSGPAGAQGRQPGGRGRPGGNRAPASGTVTPAGRSGADAGGTDVRTDYDGRRPRPVPRDVKPEQPENDQSGGAGSDQSSGLAGGRNAQRDDVAETEFQVAYTPGAATLESVGTLVPRNMQTSISEALNSISIETGKSVEAYVAENLGYSESQLGQYFSAEQVDAIAMAIRNVEQNAGFIIGDQTGVGKGRFVAAMIRYAERKGLIPIFVTEKPNLYADMIRDLSDIGMNSAKNPFHLLPTNEGLTGKEAVDLPDGRVLKSPKRLREVFANALTEFENSKQLKAGDVQYRAIATTYSQLQTVKGALTWRHEALERAIRGGMLILDESHNAGGSETQNPNAAMARADFVRHLVGQAKGVIYSSATYAKRPSVMDLYRATDMRYAVDNIQDLGEAIKRHGIPMQQVVANMLARAKQYIRRERSFEGVTFDVRKQTANKEFAENMSSIFRAIDLFDKFKQDAMANLAQTLAGSGEHLAHDSSTGSAGVSSTNFNALMHNVVDQMFLALKVESVVSEAEAALKAGEKPVIALSNTMESLLKRVYEEGEHQAGDETDLSFQDVMLHYLRRSREVTIRPPGGRRGDSYRHYLTDDELGPAALRVFNDALQLIREANLGNVPASPIDYIKHRIGQIRVNGKAVVVGEITGRSLMLDYSGPMPRFARREMADIGPGGRTKAIKKFQDGAIDVMVINQAGATGISLHADAKRAKDKRRRRMIIAQADRNIDTFMQTLGRVHRTGQVVAPSYRLLLTDLPLELRPASVLVKKLASLNANVTAESRGAVGFDVPDVMNVVGDQVAYELLAGDHELADALGLDPDEVKPVEGEPGRGIQKVTGRAALLPLNEQANLWRQLGEGFEQTLENLRAIGQNPLRAETLDLQAKILSQTVLKQPTTGLKQSPFTERAMIQRVSVKAIGKPFTSQQITEALAAAVGGSAKEPFYVLSEMGKGKTNDIRRDAVDAVRKFLSEQQFSSDQARESFQRRLNEQFNGVNQILQRAPIGSQVTVTPGGGVGEPFMGIIIGIEQTGTAKSPVAPSTWSLVIAAPEGWRQTKIPFSRFLGQEAAFGIHETGENVLAMFDRAQSEAREERFIATGNLLAAAESLNNTGQIINYTTEDGRRVDGILMPKNWEPSQFERRIIFTSAQNVIRFMEAGDTPVTENAEFMMEMDGDQVKFDAPKSKAAGGKYFLNQKALAAADAEYVSRGNRMIMTIPKARATAVIQAYMDSGISFEPPNIPRSRNRAAEIEGIETDDQLREALEGEGSGQFSGRQQPIQPPTASPRDIKAVTDELTRIAQRATGGPGMVIAPTPADLPENVVRDAESRGMQADNIEAYFGRDDQGRPQMIYVASVLAEEAAYLGIPARIYALAKWMHEAGIHYGLEGLLGAEGKAAFLQQVVRTVGLYRIRRDLPQGYEGLDKLGQAEEYLARLSERIAQGEPLPGEAGIWRRLADWLRTQLRRITGIPIRLSEGEIARVVRDAVRFAQTGERGAGSLAVAGAFSVRQKPFAEQLAALERGEWDRTKTLTVGITPDVLTMLNAPIHRLTMAPDDAIKIISEHQLTREELARIPDLMKDPIMVFAAPTTANSAVIMTEMVDGMGRQVMVAIHLNEKDGRTQVNRVASVYGRNDAKSYLLWIENGKLAFMDKKRSRLWLQSRGLQLPKEGARGGVINYSNVASEADLRKFREDLGRGDVKFSARPRRPKGEAPLTLDQLNDDVMARIRELRELQAGMAEAQEKMQARLARARQAGYRQGAKATRKKAGETVDTMAAKEAERRGEAAPKKREKPPKTITSVIHEAFRMGERAGREQGMTRAAEDLIDQSFRRIEREYEPSGNYTRWESALRRVEDELDGLDLALEQAETDEARAELAQRALRKMFGPQRYLEIRRATRGDVLETLKYLRGKLTEHEKRLYGKALRSIVQRNRAQDLYNDKRRPGFDFADQWRRLTERFREADSLAQRLKQARDYLKEMKKRGPTPSEVKAQETRIQELQAALEEVFGHMPVKEARALYEQLQGILAGSNLMQEVVIQRLRTTRAELSGRIGEEVARAHEEIPTAGERTPVRRGMARNLVVDARGSLESWAMGIGGGRTDTNAYGALYENVRDGESLSATAQADAHKALIRKLEELGFTDDEIRDLQTDEKVYTLAGHDHRFTRAQLMSLYLHMLDAEAVGKLYRNGFKGEQKRGLNKLGEDVIANLTEELTTEKLAERLTGKLTEREKSLARAMREILAGMSEEGNRTALRLKGREIFLNDTYWPLSVDRGVQPKLELEQMSPGYGTEQLDRLGMLRERVPHGNPIVLRNAFDVFAEHVTKMADFTHQSLPTLDALAVLNDPATSDALIRRLGKRFPARIRETLARTAHLQTHSDKWRYLGRVGAGIERRAAAAILGFRLTSIANNLVGGSILMMNELGKLSPTYAAQYAAYTQPATFWAERGRRIKAKLLTSGYLYNRWVMEPTRVYANLPTDEESVSGRFAKQRLRLRALTNFALHGMAAAEMMNAAQAYAVLTRNGWSEADAVRQVEIMTRRTQNPSTAIEESGFYTTVKEHGGVGLVFPFFGQPTVASNVLLRDAYQLAHAMKTGRGRKEAAIRTLGSMAALGANSLFSGGLTMLVTAAGYGLLSGGGGDDEEERVVRYGLARMIGDSLDTLVPGGGYLLADPLAEAMASVVRGDDLEATKLLKSIYMGPTKQVSENMLVGMAKKPISGAKKIVDGWQDEDYSKLLRGVYDLVDAVGMAFGVPVGGITQVAKSAQGVLTKGE
ncbi:MAG TPA: strawberry notch C-terminal domain-containing protein [Candidatus Sumerlaeota bacterium]|nr:strawberry notch C-terminal domain-containing protein [Candidatus Sumerlaeota bacterium]